MLTDIISPKVRRKLAELNEIIYSCFGVVYSTNIKCRVLSSLSLKFRRIFFLATFIQDGGFYGGHLKLKTDFFHGHNLNNIKKIILPFAKQLTVL